MPQHHGVIMQPHVLPLLKPVPHASMLSPPSFLQDLRSRKQQQQQQQFGPPPPAQRPVVAAARTVSKQPAGPLGSPSDPRGVDQAEMDLKAQAGAGETRTASQLQRACDGLYQSKQWEIKGDRDKVREGREVPPLHCCG